MTTEPRKPLNLRLNCISLAEEDDQDIQILNTTANPLLPDRTSLLSLEEYENHSEENEYYNLSTKICNRESMEDRFDVVLFSPSSENLHGFFSIFDGHTNFYVAEYLKQNLYSSLIQELERSKEGSIPDAFKRTYQQLNDRIIQILAAHQLNGGSTALSAYVNKDKVILANLGDCRAFTMSKSYAIEQITKDHRFTSESERIAAQGRGATILAKGSKYLLEGSLAVSRAFGDINYKDYLSCTPDTYEFAINDEHKYLILSTDGFWELASDLDELQKVIRNCEIDLLKQSNPQTAPGLRQRNLSTRVLEYYIEKFNKTPKDNMALVIIDLEYIKRNIGSSSTRQSEECLNRASPAKNSAVSPLKKAFGFCFDIDTVEDEIQEDVTKKFDRALTFHNNNTNETSSPCKKQSTPFVKPGVQKMNLFTFS